MNTKTLSIGQKRIRGEPMMKLSRRRKREGSKTRRAGIRGRGLEIRGATIAKMTRRNHLRNKSAQKLIEIKKSALNVMKEACQILAIEEEMKIEREITKEMIKKMIKSIAGRNIGLDREIDIVVENLLKIESTTGIHLLSVRTKKIEIEGQIKNLINLANN